MLGDKATAKETMKKKAGVPVIPGSEGAVRSVEEAMEAAKINWISAPCKGFGRRRRQRH